MLLFKKIFTKSKKTNIKNTKVDLMYIKISHVPSKRELLIAFLTRDFYTINDTQVELEKIGIETTIPINSDINKAKNIVKQALEKNDFSLYQLEQMAKRIIIKGLKEIRYIDANINELEIYYKEKEFLIRNLVRIGYYGKINDFLKSFIDYKSLAENECVNESRIFKYFEEIETGLKKDNYSYNLIFYILNEIKCY